MTNYHEPGEGRCDLDRFFAVMTAHERATKIRGLDITGVVSNFYLPYLMHPFKLILIYLFS